MQVPEVFLNQPADHDEVLPVGDNSLVLLNRNFETEKSRIVLNKNVISFGLQGYKYFHSSLEDVVVGKGETIFLKKGLLISTEKVQEAGVYKALLLFLDDQLLSDFYERHKSHFARKAEGQEALTYFKLGRDVVLETYVQSLLPFFQPEATMTSPLFEVKIHELLLHLAMRHVGFSHFLENINLQMSLGLKPFMEKNFRRRLRVEDFAHLMGLSLSNFKREFEKAFGDSPARWIKMRRLTEAQTMLSQSRMNVGQVAYAVGFENTSHFVQSFRSQFGITPKKFQERNP